MTPSPFHSFLSTSIPNHWQHEYVDTIDPYHHLDLIGFTTAVPALLNRPSSSSHTPLFFRTHSSLFAICSSIALAAFRFCCRACLSLSMTSRNPSSNKSPHSSYWSMVREAKNALALAALSLCVLSGYMLCKRSDRGRLASGRPW